MFDTRVAAFVAIGFIALGACRKPAREALGADAPSKKTAPADGKTQASSAVCIVMASVEPKLAAFYVED
jgi:hypothetical protein